MLVVMESSEKGGGADPAEDCAKRLKSKNNNNNEDNINFNIDHGRALPNSWHPHVYSKLPKAPTPHLISNILGIPGGGRAGTENEQPLNLTTRVRRRSPTPDFPRPGFAAKAPAHLNGLKGLNGQPTSVIQPAGAKAPRRHSNSDKGKICPILICGLMGH